MREAFLELGMPATHVTHEIYFNHKEVPGRGELVRAVEALTAPPVRITAWSGAET